MFKILQYICITCAKCAFVQISLYVRFSLTTAEPNEGVIGALYTYYRSNFKRKTLADLKHATYETHKLKGMPNGLIITCRTLKRRYQEQTFYKRWFTDSPQRHVLPTMPNATSLAQWDIRFKNVPHYLSAIWTRKNILWMQLWRHKYNTTKKGNNLQWKWPPNRIMRHI